MRGPIYGSLDPGLCAGLLDLHVVHTNNEKTYTVLSRGISIIKTTGLSSRIASYEVWARIQNRQPKRTTAHPLLSSAVHTTRLELTLITPNDPAVCTAWHPDREDWDSLCGSSTDATGSTPCHRFRLFSLCATSSAGIQASHAHSKPYWALSQACRCSLPWSHEVLPSDVPPR